MILTDKQLPTDVAEYVTNDEAIDVIAKLEWELHHSPTPGIGLAAPQIGINKAVAIIRIKNPFDPSDPMICVNLVNPELVEASNIIPYSEGCLSFPGSSVSTIRYAEIIVKTSDDYAYQAEQMNARRYNRTPEKMPLFSKGHRFLRFGQMSEEPELYHLEQLTCVCVQHEFSHLLGLTMFDFKPEEIGRNDECPCGSDKKNKKCHGYKYHNNNLLELFSPKYVLPTGV